MSFYPMGSAFERALGTIKYLYPQFGIGEEVDWEDIWFCCFQYSSVLFTIALLLCWNFTGLPSFSLALQVSQAFYIQFHPPIEPSTLFQLFRFLRSIYSYCCCFCRPLWCNEHSASLQLSATIKTETETFLDSYFHRGCTHGFCWWWCNLSWVTWAFMATWAAFWLVTCTYPAFCTQIQEGRWFNKIYRLLDPLVPTRFLDKLEGTRLLSRMVTRDGYITSPSHTLPLSSSGTRYLFVYFGPLLRLRGFSVLTIIQGLRNTIIAVV